MHVLDHALEFGYPGAASLLPSAIPVLLEAGSDSDSSVSLVSGVVDLLMCLVIIHTII